MTTALERTRQAFEAVDGVDLTEPRAIRAFGRLFAPEMEFDLGVIALPDEPIWRGRDEALRGWTRWLEQWEDYRISVSNLVAQRDDVLFDVHVEARGRGSGVPIKIEHVQIWTWRGEELLGIGVFADRESALEALGERS